MDIEDRGVRPASLRKDDSVIAKVAFNAGTSLGFNADMGTGSTDANIPMSLGYQAITLDGGATERGHTPRPSHMTMAPKGTWDRSGSRWS